MSTLATPSRKSVRHRTPNPKFTSSTVVPLSALTDLLSDSSDDQLALQESDQRLPPDDFDFPADDLANRNPDSASTSESDPADGNLSEGSAILTPVEDYEDAHSYASGEESGEEVRRLGKGGGQRGKGRLGYEDVRSRGLMERQLRGLDDRMEALSGPGVRDYQVLRETLGWWGKEAVLPRRKRLRVPFGHTRGMREMEGGRGWDWYYGEGGREAFARRQGGRVLGEGEGVGYLPRGVEGGCDVLMGPYGRQKLVTLSHLQAAALEGGGAGAQGELDTNQQTSRKLRRHGWMLNVGEKVLCLDWAPNHDGPTQYLALGLAQRPNETSQEPPKTPRAFTPDPPTPSSVQIWAFPATQNPQMESSLDSKRIPELRLVLCNEWGDAKQLKWCPMPRENRDEQARGEIFIGLLAGVWGDGYARVLDVKLDKGRSAATTYLKLDSAAFTSHAADAICTCLGWLSPTHLAIGHSNGYVAIYDLFPRSKISTTSVPLQPRPNTTESSPQGNSAEPTDPSDPSNTTPPTLYLTIAPHHSTISPLLSLASAYPTHPSLLATSSITGSTRLLDLSAPLTDYVLSIRTRSPPSTLVYSPHLYSVLFADEPSETIRANGLRHWGGGTALAKTAIADADKGIKRDSGRRTGMGIGFNGRGCIDSGTVHPCVAWGGADGCVVVNNPVAKVLGGRRALPVVWQMCVFRQEWVRRQPQSAPSQDNSGAGRRIGGGGGGGGDVQMPDRDSHPHEDRRAEGIGGNVEMPEQNPRPQEGRRTAGIDADVPTTYPNPPSQPPIKPRGISRITESYKPEKVFFGLKGDRPASTTVFEEETGVTAVRWNSSLSCGGWLAVGWGSGLLRVEDLAI